MEAFANDEPLPLPPRSGPETTDDARRIASITGGVDAFRPWFSVAVALLSATDDRPIPEPVKNEGRSAQAVWSVAQLGLAFAVTAVLSDLSDATEVADPSETTASADYDTEQLLKRALSLLNWRSGGWEYRVQDGELCRRRRGTRSWETYELQP